MSEVISGVRSEIKVDSQGKGSITKHGLAVLLGISHSLLNRDRLSKKLAQILSDRGFDSRDLESNCEISDIHASCIIEYYALDAQKTSENAKTLYRAFAAVGVRAWFQDVTGFDKPKPLSQYEQFKQAHTALSQMIAVYEYAATRW